MGLGKLEKMTGTELGIFCHRDMSVRRNSAIRSLMMRLWVGDCSTNKETEITIRMGRTEMLKFSMPEDQQG